MLDGDDANPLRLVDSVDGFRARASVGGTLRDSFVIGDPWYDWAALDAVDLRLDASSQFRTRSLQRSWSTAVLPRNVLSQ